MTENLTSIKLASAAVIVMVLAGWSSLWAKAPSVHAADMSGSAGLVGTLHSSQATPSEFRLAMMDDMDMMGGAMPSAAPPVDMPPTMTNPPAADPMGEARTSMQGQRGMSNLPSTSRLPGFPGGSHLYHIGASGFFLDHPQHITLTVEQQTLLNGIKEKALLDRASSARRIQDAEQELWALTAAEAPDVVKIEAKVRAIEKLGGDQRLAVIRAVGEAARVLTAEQQAALLGMKPSAVSKPAAQSMPASPGKPAPMAAPMPDM